MVAPVISLILIFIAPKISETLKLVLSGFLGCMMGCGMLTWWISGIIWRFRSDGSFSCGDTTVFENSTDANDMVHDDFAKITDSKDKLF